MAPFETPHQDSMIIQSHKIDEPQQNKVFYHKILSKLKEDVISEIENILVNKSKESFEHGHFLIKFIKKYKNKKIESLQKLSVNFYDVPSFEDLKKDL